MNKKYLAFLLLIIMGTTLFASCHETSASALGLTEGWKEDIEKQAGGATDWINNIPGVGTIAKYLISGVVGAVAVVLLLVTQGVMELGQILLGWVTSEGFINIQFTDNLFVNEGWGIIRGLTNILIVLGLVAIALATILRIESYQMKKTLPSLLIVALLINFTPMLCGLMIDASNIVMNHFLKAGQFLTQSYGSAVVSGVAEIFRNADSPSTTLATSLLLVGSSLFSGIVFFLFAFLFLFRYIALWMLVILSPLALFCLIFPNTKRMWNQWLSQFTQWCFIGIPAAFTIYLANMMTQQMLQGNLLGEMSSASKILGYIVPVAFLYFGLLMSLQTGAMGASLATNLGKWTGTKGLPMLAGGVGAGAIGAVKGIKEGKGWGKIKGAGRGIFTQEGRDEGKEVVDMALERMHVVRPGFYMERKLKRAKLDEEEKRLKPLSSDELQRIEETRAVTSRDRRAKAVATKLLGDRGHFGFKGTPEEVKKKEKEAIDLAKKMGADLSGLSKSRPELTPEINSEKFQEQLQAEIEDFQKKNPGFNVTATIIEKRKKIVRRNMIGEQVGKISAKDFTEKVSSDSPKDLDVFLGMTAAQIEHAGAYGNEAKIKAIEDAYKDNVIEISMIYNKFKKQGKTREAQRLADLVTKIGEDPNFSI